MTPALRQNTLGRLKPGVRWRPQPPSPGKHMLRAPRPTSHTPCPREARPKERSLQEALWAIPHRRRLLHQVTRGLPQGWGTIHRYPRRQREEGSAPSEISGQTLGPTPSLSLKGILQKCLGIYENIKMKKVREGLKNVPDEEMRDSQVKATWTLGP